MQSGKWVVWERPRPAPGGAGFGIDHDPGGLDEPTPQGRGQSESDAGRITAGVADDPVFRISSRKSSAGRRPPFDAARDRARHSRTRFCRFPGSSSRKSAPRSMNALPAASQAAAVSWDSPWGRAAKTRSLRASTVFAESPGEVAELPQGGIDRREGFPFKRNRPHCRDLDPGMGEEKAYELDARHNRSRRGYRLGSSRNSSFCIGAWARVDL